MNHMKITDDSRIDPLRIEKLMNLKQCQPYTKTHHVWQPKKFTSARASKASLKLSFATFF